MAALSKMYEKSLALSKIFLMKFNQKMTDNGSVAEPLNEFNTLMSQQEYIRINVDDEIRALVLLPSLLETCDGFVMATSNSCGT